MRTYKSGGKRIFDCTRKTAFGLARKLEMPETRRYIEGLQRKSGGGVSKGDARAKALAIDSLRLLGCDDERVYESAKSYLLSLENNEWGFSSEHGQDSSLDGTHYAVSCLKKLGVEKKEAADYVLRLQRNNGSFFRDEAHSKTEIPGRELGYDSLYNTTLAVLTLKMTGCDEKPVFEKAEKFIRRQQHLDGSFGIGSGSIKETYYAISALDGLGELDDSASQRAQKFIVGMQSDEAGGFFSMMQGDFSTSGRELNWRVSENVENTFYAISALKIVGGLDDEVCRKAKNYVGKLANDEGGFGYSLYGLGANGEPSGTSSLLGTAYAVLTLGLLEGKSP